MNETVAKIVELLFQDVEMNDEVSAIHDEVMNNCQERFGDLLHRGLTEDEAIAEVVESLKGMEEVLAAYPRREAAEEKPAPAPDFRVQNAVLSGNGARAAFGARSLRRVSVCLKHEDLTIEPSPDEQVRVICNMDEGDRYQSVVVAELVDGELRVTRQGDGEGRSKAHVRVDSEGFDFSGRDFNFANLGDMLGKLMRNIQVNFDGGDERVCVQVPESVHLERVQVQTTSGDVGMDGVMADTLDVSSRSGDLRLELPGGHRLDRVELHTTSGDIEAWLSADRAGIQSLSGDIRYVGAARELDVSSTSGDVTVELNAGGCEQCKMRSVSGDVELTGAARQISAGTTSGDVEVNARSEAVGFSSVSGDIRLIMEGDGLRQIEGHTTSGDVNVRLPQGVRQADINIHTTSGDVRLGVDSVSGAPLRIAMNTVSGDVTVR